MMRAFGAPQFVNKLLLLHTVFSWQKGNFGFGGELGGWNKESFFCLGFPGNPPGDNHTHTHTVNSTKILDFLSFFDLNKRLKNSKAS